MNVLTKISPLWFYVPLFIVGFLATVRFAIQSGFYESALGVGLALGFAMMGIGGFVLLPMYLFAKGGTGGKDITGNKTNFSHHLHGFVLIGCGIAFFISIVNIFAPGFSIIATPFQTGTLLSTATENLATFDRHLANTVMAPLMETFVFVGHFLFAWILVTVLGKIVGMGNTMKNVMLIIFYIIFSSITFYYFHVGLVGVTSFLISVVIYRSLMGFLIFGDKLFNIVPFMTIAIAAEFGFHWVGNIQNTIGFIEWFRIMLTDTFGTIAVGVFVFYILLEIYNLKAKGDKM